jgi:hypothetical protein
MTTPTKTLPRLTAEKLRRMAGIVALENASPESKKPWNVLKRTIATASFKTLSPNTSE